MDKFQGELDKEIEPTKIDADVIKPIKKDAVHKICSGQVVLSLSIAMKELIENAIDADASIIDVRLKEYGSDFLEVSDNGSGVKKDNFQSLTLKHYTSKIREFSDLENISTLGFRGEALSSLSALSDLSVTTKHFTAEIATKITYDTNGRIKSETPTAREQGTTVVLENLFSTLPVRRKEFVKNLKREFNKMCQLLYSYCLVSKGIKFTCTNLTNNGSKSTVVATEGQKSVRENIISVFGAKQISCLVDVPLKVPDEVVQKEYDLKMSVVDEVPFSFECLISSVMHGSGRSSSDRQFFYINSRPCEPIKLMKLVNEIYKQFNGNQYPFVYINITTKGTLVDVNVTPDKRQVFLEQEKLLLATLKASLLDVFKTFPSTFKTQNMDISKRFLVIDKKKDRGIKRSLTDSVLKRGSILESFKKRSKTEFNESIKIEKQELNLSSDEEIEKTLEWSRNLDGLLESATNLSVDQDIEISIDLPVEKSDIKTVIPLNISMESIKARLKHKNPNKLCKEDIKVRFRSQVTPEANKSAEEELEKHITKEDFKEMSIIGQFNLGFIVTKLGNDLFIVDQHASDEKYNFEQLQLSTVLENQKLVSPKPLELTSGNETLLIENEEIFKKNGFTFIINSEAPATKKVSLAAIPISKGTTFGKDDVDEMLFMLQDSNSTSCRPSKVRQMFASRACRKSVMIGKSLCMSDMRKLIDHMGDINQPWNCPHGRPTMRHLVNLDLIKND